MANHVRVSVIGAAPIEERCTSNERGVQRMISHLRDRVGQVLPDRPDLIVLPEACDQFHWQVRENVHDAYYVARGDRVLDALARVAREHRCYIAYPGLRRLDDGSYRNSIRIIDRTGGVAGTYDKNYPTLSELEMGIEPGAEARLIACDFGTVACAICFDLNFDELRLRVARQRPDLVVFASVYHGGLMQAYWAYSCRAHFAGAVARLPSAILSPVGHSLASSTNYQDFVTTTVNLDCEVVHLSGNRAKIPAMKATYGREVSIFDPGLLGPVLVSSESDTVTASQMIDAYGIERIDPFLDRCTIARNVRVEQLQRQPDAAVDQVEAVP